MSKKSREYWQQRSEQVQEALLNKADTYYDDLERIYKMANMDIQKEIDAWYRRFAKNNCISYLDAKQLLTSNELKEFKWTVEDYIKYGEKNAINQQWMKELENASARVHISRLEALQIQLQQRMEALFNNQIDDVDKLVKGIYSDGYYHTAFELQKGFNTGFNLQEFNNNELEKIVSKPWTTDGTNFSKRIWGEYRPELVNVVHTQLTQTLIRGIPPDKAIKTIAEKFNTTKSRAGNLVMTESAYFSSLSREDCYNDLGIGDYEIVATLDFKTSVTCRHLDGEHFPLSEYEVWVTAPPFHHRCRTTTCPYFDDEFTLGEKRAARGIDGKTYYVNSNMEYTGWKKKFIKDTSKSDEGDILDKAKSIFQNKTKAKIKEFEGGLDNVSNENVKKLLAQSEERTNFAKSKRKSSYFSQEERTIFLKDSTDTSTVAHELFHEIDYTYGISESDMISNQIQNDYSRLKNISIGYGKGIDEMLYFKYPDIFEANALDKRVVSKEYRGISDIIHGMTSGKIDLGYGHRQKGYWNRENSLQKETWAQYGRMLYENDDKVIEILNKLFPETSNEVIRILEEMIK